MIYKRRQRGKKRKKNRKKEEKGKYKKKWRKVKNGNGRQKKTGKRPKLFQIKLGSN